MFNLLREKEDTKETKKDTKAPEPTDEGIEYYNIDLAVSDPNIRVGEIDFSDWNEQIKSGKFRVIVTKEGSETPLPTNSQAYKKALATIKKFPILSSAYSYLGGNPLTPKIKVEENISKSSGGFGIIDWFKSFWDPTARITIDTDGGRNPHLESDKYISGLIHLATDKAKEGDFSILENYYGAIEQAIKNEQLANKKKRANWEKELAARQKRQLGRKIFKTLAITGAVIVAIAVSLVIAGTIISFLPITGPIAAVATGLVTLGSAAVSVTVAGAGFLFGAAKGFFGSVLGSGLAALGMATLITGIFKNGIPDYKDQYLKLIKRDITKSKETEKELEKDLKKVNSLKKGTKSTFEKILSLTKDADSLNLDNEEIADAGLAIICNHMIRDDTNLTCKKLSLINCGITEKGTKALADTLVKAQENPNQANISIREIDLTDNNIGNNGIFEIFQAMPRNFTLIDLKYDRNIDADPAYKDEIDRQLIMNRYLQNVKPLWSETTHINDLFPGGTDEIKEKATKKLKENYNIKAFPVENRSELATNVINQNILFAKLRSQKPTADDYLNAWKIDSERINKFTRNLFPEDATKTKEQKQKIQRSIGKDPLKLRTLETNKCIEALKPIFPGNKIQNVRIFAAVLGKLATESEQSDILKIMKPVIKNLYDNLGTASSKAFKGLLETIRKDIATKYEINIKTRTTISNIFDEILQDKKGAELLKYQLQRLVVEHPSDLQETFKEFMDLYKNIPEKELASLFAKVDYDKFMELVRKDIYDGKTAYTQLRRPDLSENHKKALLAFCFRSESEAEDKALLIASILSTEETTEHFLDNQSTANFREQYLCYTISYPSATGLLGDYKAKTFAEIKSELEKIRKKALADADYESTEILDRPLQTIIQQKLDTSNLEALKTELDANYDLRQFDFSKTTLNPETKSYIENIIIRNRLKDILQNGPKEKLEKFLSIYKNIAKDRKQILANIMRTDGALIRELIKNDINNPPYEALKTLNKTQKIEILAACRETYFQQADANKLHSHAIATMVVELLDLDVPDEYIWRIFDWKTKSKWPFDQYIEELKGLASKNDDVDEIIQHGLQEDIIYRLNTTTDLEKPPKWLVNELNENYDLIDIEGFNLSESSIHPTIQEYIKYICKRNQLIETVENHNWQDEQEQIETVLDEYAKHDYEKEKHKLMQNFMEEYSKLPTEEYSKIPEEDKEYNITQKKDSKKKFKYLFYHISNLDLLKLVTEDLGTKTNVTCNQLRNLDENHRIRLLKHCFSINETPEDAYRKAILVSKILDIPQLFEQKDDTNNLIKEYLIYWAITSQNKDKPYYLLKNLLEGSYTGYSVDKLKSKSKIPEVIQGLQTALIAVPKAEETKMEISEIVTKKVAKPHKKEEPTHHRKMEMTKK